MSIRDTGSYIGFNRVPTTAQGSASGIWSLRSVERQMRAAAWPQTPFPQTISGLQLFLDASDASTLYNATSGGSLVAANGEVSRWEDKSGNGRHATQGTAANRPVRITSQQNGRDVIRADGLSQFIQTTAFSSALLRSLFVVAVSQQTPQTDTFATLVGQVDSALGSGDADPFAIGTTNVGTGAQFNRLRCITRNDSNTAFVQNFADTAFVTNTPFLTSYINSGTGVFRFNSTAATFPTAGLHATFTKRLTLFGQADDDQSVSQNFWNGDIAEILIYDSALSDASREAVENYLRAKWGIA